MNKLKLSYQPATDGKKGKQNYVWTREGEQSVVVCRSAWMLIYNVSENRMTSFGKKGAIISVTCARYK